jgi:hypothetical protein
VQPEDRVSSLALVAPNVMPRPVPLTPDQAGDLVRWAGSQRAAARATGVCQSSISHWLNPEAARRRHRRRWDDGRDWHQQPENHDRKLATQRERYYRLRDQGLCTKCGEPIMTETLCWDCVTKKEDSALLTQARQAGYDVSSVEELMATQEYPPLRPLDPLPTAGGDTHSYTSLEFTVTSRS